MKKLLIPILLLMLAFPAMSQQFLTVNGIVTDTATGNPIPNHAVNIHNDSNSLGYFYHTVLTNNSGFYNDTIIILNGVTQGNLYVNTSDCQNYLHQQWFVYSPAQSNFTANFAICYNNNPCQANFYASAQGLTVQFTDASVGGGTTRQWQFGDGATSSQMNPLHSYGAPGYYNVTLTIGALGTTCYNSITQTVAVLDSTSGGCQAAFIAIPDTNNSNYTYNFMDQSSGNIISWGWNFGDPTSGTNNVSTLQNPTHIYSQPGSYTACLTIHGSDSSCYDVTCETIVIGSGGGCQAAFTIVPDSMNTPNSFYFIDQSAGNITTWVWDFGDGTPPVTINFPSNPNTFHSYSIPGYYMVCLSIQGANGCFDMTCDTLVVGSNTGCDANFFTSIPISTAYPTLFQDASQGGGGLPIVSWNWNFGDPASGANNTSSLQNPSHTFNVAGIYNVCLTIQGADSSCYDVTCQNIVVQGDSGCQANFLYTIDSVVGKTVAFTDISTGNPTSWLWSFGDGTSATTQNPVHTYNGTAPSYNVCLTITGNNCTSTYCQNVVFTDSTNYHQVYGQVFAGNFPVTMGLAMIFSLDSNATNQLFSGVCPLDSNGVYYFTMVPDGNYYILAMPFDSNGYLPTYYGNTISWEQATQIILGTENNPYNINLVQSDQMTPGPGSTSGQINMGDVNSSLLDKINMILMNDQSAPIGFTQVSTSGVFNFPTLAYGTYYLHPEMPGVSGDVVKFTLTAEKPHADVVMTFTGNKILGLQDEQSLVNQWSVFPNPVNDHLTINLDLKQDIQVVVEIHNLTGKVMTSKSVVLQNGNNSISLSTSNLPVGLYMLRVSSKEGVNINTKLVKIR
ncbi:MAG: PKD domain-containing protein [Bacteroidota bacterium]